MEKIIGGKELNFSFPISIQHKILWPCYEFIAEAEGVDDFEKNIIEEVVLRLADINVTDVQEIADCTGLEKDLISFMQSRLEQRGGLDNCYRITDVGKQKLGKFTEKHSKEIHIYVDAVSGRIIPYYNMINGSVQKRFTYSYGKEENNFFKYKVYSTAGKETDEEIIAYKLHYTKDEYNQIPDGKDVTDMLHKLYPKKDGVFAKIDEEQTVTRNLCWILLDIMQPEGSSRDWVFTDGFGHITSFFSVEQIKNENDKQFIINLRTEKKVQTNASEKDSVSLIDKEYHKLSDKIKIVQKNMKEFDMTVDSPDSQEELLSVIEDSLLSLTQFAEWILYYALHRGENEYKAKTVIDDFEKFKDNKGSGVIIGGIASKCTIRIGFDFELEDKQSLTMGYGKLKSSFEKTPALIALLDILLIAFDKEPWLRRFAKEHSDFITVLIKLNRNRNASFHAGFDGDKDSLKEFVKKAYKEICDFMKIGLGIEMRESGEFTFAEKIAKQNERDAAISRMEQALGFTLCRTLNSKLIRFITDMERRGIDADSLNNAIIKDQYRILEYLFVSVNGSLGDECKNQDWKAKVKSAGFDFADSKEYDALLKTNQDKINAALDRKPATMNAACIAFCTLADKKLLGGVKDMWKSMIADVSYITHKRGHGEIPNSINAEYVLDIKKHIIDLIHFFAENGFLSDKGVN